MRTTTVGRTLAGLVAVLAIPLASAMAANGAVAAAGPAASARPDFRAPWACGEIRDYFHHAGEVVNAIDLNIAGSSDLGMPALASAAGTVTSAQANGGYGNEVVVDHSGGWSSRVAHLSAFSVHLAVYRPSDATFYVRWANGTTGRIPFGERGDLPAIGHYENSVYDNLAVYRPSTATFYIRMADGTVSKIPYGNVGDLPAPGYFKGLAYTNLAVYRPSTNSFYIRKASLSTQTVVFGAGNLGDVPAIGKFQ